MNKEIKIAGKKIFYRVYGDSKPVMFVHGFGETGDVWKAQIEFLKDNLPAGEAGYQLIVPDLPGSGQSEMIEDMSMEGMAEVLKIILDTELSDSTKKISSKETHKSSESSKVSPLGVAEGQERSSLEGPAPTPPATLIGHSMGGYITLAFAEKYGDELGAFGLFHSSAYADKEEKKAVRRKGIEFIKEHGAFEFLKTSTPNLFSPVTTQRFPDLIGQFIQSLNNFSPDALVKYYESMINRPDRTTVLEKAKIPVLFVMGKYDNAIPLEDGLKQCHLPERSYIHILHQSGHMGMMEETDKSNRLLKEFLNAI
jgi:pimeloyl-ACP methyl ester carboxylesterase